MARVHIFEIVGEVKTVFDDEFQRRIVFFDARLNRGSDELLQLSFFEDDMKRILHESFH